MLKFESRFFLNIEPCFNSKTFAQQLDLDKDVLWFSNLQIGISISHSFALPKTEKLLSLP